MDYRKWPEMSEDPPYLMAGLIAARRLNKIDLGERYRERLNDLLLTLDLKIIDVTAPPKDRLRAAG